LKARYLVDKSALARMPLAAVRDLQAELARSGHHRVPIPDLIIAAAAEAAGLTLLHYDHDYDTIAEVTRQPAEWVVQRGTV
jgi:predicted nucleic acid-binding protein